MSGNRETDAVLIRMRDPGKRVKRGGDIRRRTVVGADGAEVGTVRALYIDPTTQRVRFLEVVSRGLPGFARAKTLIPVALIMEVDDRVVRIDENTSSKPRIGYDPTLGDLLSNYDSFGPLS